MFRWHKHKNSSDKRTPSSQTLWLTAGVFLLLTWRPFGALSLATVHVALNEKDNVLMQKAVRVHSGIPPAALYTFTVQTLRLHLLARNLIIANNCHRTDENIYMGCLLLSYIYLVVSLVPSKVYPHTHYKAVPHSTCTIHKQTPSWTQIFGKSST